MADGATIVCQSLSKFVNEVFCRLVNPFGLRVLPKLSAAVSTGIVLFAVVGSVMLERMV
jgi:hypothetical protein